jgi:serine/threonine protein kinase
MSDQTFLKTEIGTREYLAPEVLGYVDEETSCYTNAVDIWSLGCICHRLLTTELPFAKITALAPYCWGGKDLPIDALQKATVSEEGIMFIRKLMAPQPSERLDAEAALQSPWLEDVDSLEPKLTLEPAPSRSVSHEKDRSSYDIANVNSAAGTERCETPSNTMKRVREKCYRLLISKLVGEEASQAFSITESEDETSDSETPSEPQQGSYTKPHSVALTDNDSRMDTKLQATPSLSECWVSHFRL